MAGNVFGRMLGAKVHVCDYGAVFQASWSS